MNKNLGVKNYFSRHESVQNVPAIQQLLEEIGAEPTLVEQLNAACEIYDFQLGDEITKYQNLDSDSYSIDKKQIDNNCYLVSQGRVRLLVVSATKQEEISAVILEVGEIFGTDNLFIENGVAYRAIAVGTCQMARIDVVKLQSILEKCPQLQHHLQAQFQRRQWLIFFKTQTELGTLAPQQQQILWPQLLPYIEETRIPAGVSLAQQYQKVKSHFWLRSGQIQGEKPPIIGSSWGHPDSVSEDWQAKTDLLVYQLNSVQWEIATATIANNSNSSPKIIRKPHTSTLIQPPQNSNHTSPTKSPKLIAVDNSQSKGVGITFPKPKRRKWFGSGHPFIQQQSSADCGTTCLAMISK